MTQFTVGYDVIQGLIGLVEVLWTSAVYGGIMPFIYCVCTEFALSALYVHRFVYTVSFSLWYDIFGALL